MKETRFQKFEDTKCQNFLYRQDVGALMYLMVGTRPDIAYKLGYLPMSLENPSSEDMVKLKRVFRYIAGTIHFAIIYHATGTSRLLECYSDGNFGACALTGRSTSGSVVLYAGGAISWHSQKQAIIATLTTEAKVVAASEAVKEVLWLSRLSGNSKLDGSIYTPSSIKVAAQFSHNP